MSNISDFFIAVLVIEFINHPVNDSAYSDILLPCQDSDSLPCLLRYRYGCLHSLDARMDRFPATPRSRSSSCLFSNHTSLHLMGRQPSPCQSITLLFYRLNTPVLQYIVFEMGDGVRCADYNKNRLVPLEARFIHAICRIGCNAVLVSEFTDFPELLNCVQCDF